MLHYVLKRETKKPHFFVELGAGDVTRTHDLLITNQLHYRLCYTSVLDFDNVSIIPDSFPFVNIIL